MAGLSFCLLCQTTLNGECNLECWAAFWERRLVQWASRVPENNPDDSRTEAHWSALPDIHLGKHLLCFMQRMGAGRSTSIAKDTKMHKYKHEWWTGWMHERADLLMLPTKRNRQSEIETIWPKMHCQHLVITSTVWSWSAKQTLATATLHVHSVDDCNWLL